MQSFDAVQDLANQVKHQIHTRSFGRVRDLDVEFSGPSVVLRGRALTYYAKQLAQHGALEALDGRTIVNAIDVD